MGINGLLKTLDQLQRPVSQDLSEYRDKRIAVDTYVWLHRGLQAGNAAMDVVTGKPTNLHLNYCVRRLEVLLSAGVAEVVLVFDGCPLPAKLGVEDDRKKRREEARELGLEYRKAGNYTAARKMFTRAADVTPDMAAELISVVRGRQFGPRVRWLVAPYEADSQLAYLALNGLVDAVISEDSDLLPFGCPHVIYKLDLVAGSGRGAKCRAGVSISLPRRMLPEAVANDASPVDPDNEVGEGVCRFSRDSFLHYCVLAGCDYLPSVTGMGPKKAYGFVLRGGPSISRIMNLAQIAGLEFPEDYADLFQRALLTFRHQTIWCPVSRKLRPLLDINEEVHYPTETRQFWGKLYSNPEAERVADGILHPETKMAFQIKSTAPTRAAHVRPARWTQQRRQSTQNRRSSVASTARPPARRRSPLATLFKACEQGRWSEASAPSKRDIDVIDLDEDSLPMDLRGGRTGLCEVMQVVSDVSDSKSPFISEKSSRVSLPVYNTSEKGQGRSPRSLPDALSEVSNVPGASHRAADSVSKVTVYRTDSLDEFRNPDEKPKSANPVELPRSERCARNSRASFPSSLAEFFYRED
ncbi:Rad2 nuclease [Perkinsus olseni]|uniref:Rad2 nuclease n=1 Tax=Perkinsus olseni TaxID=32597 RepID=A0A7J6LDQ4_PEROL|nr:Rad2 nuclease [Perkinsus olseni]